MSNGVKQSRFYVPFTFTCNKQVPYLPVSKIIDAQLACYNMLQKCTFGGKKKERKKVSTNNTGIMDRVLPKYSNILFN